MRIIGWLLTRMLLLRFFIILFGITIFVLSLDLIANTDDILKLHNGDLSAIAVYASLRAPGLASQFVIISALIAALLMLTDISRHSELVAIWSSGVSQFRIIAALMPVATLIGIGHFLLIDRAVPAVTPLLHEWGIGDFSEKALNIGPNDPIWMRAGNDILRAKKTNAAATELEDIIIFRRDSEGLITEQVFARKATLINGRWVLTDVATYFRANEDPVRLSRLIYSEPLRPATEGTRSGDPAEMSLATLSYFITNAGFGIRPAHVYRTWRHKRIATLLSTILMIVIAVPLSIRFRRGGGLGLFFVTGIAMGFGFFLFEGISLTMGELGIMPPWFAAWTPILVFLSAAGAIAFKQENL